MFWLPGSTLCLFVAGLDGYCSSLDGVEFPCGFGAGSEPGGSDDDDEVDEEFDEDYDDELSISDPESDGESEVSLDAESVTSEELKLEAKWAQYHKHINAGLSTDVPCQCRPPGLRQAAPYLSPADVPAGSATATVAWFKNKGLQPYSYVAFDDPEFAEIMGGISLYDRIPADELHVVRVHWLLLAMI